MPWPAAVRSVPLAPTPLEASVACSAQRVCTRRLQDRLRAPYVRLAGRLLEDRLHATIARHEQPF